MALLVDKYLMLWIIASISYIAMEYTIKLDILSELPYFVLAPTMHFLAIMYLRLRLKWTILSKGQLLLLKLTLLATSVGYFLIGVDYMLSTFGPTKGRSPEIDDTYRDLCLLFVYAHFLLFY
jgi:hypothetical protein